MAILTTDGWSYSYDAITKSDLKDYVISQDNYDGVFGSMPVLKAVGSGTDRFYVMALSDFTTSEYNEFCWYSGLSDSGGLAEDSSFGSGKQNTLDMISLWKADTNSSKNATRDMWSVVQSSVTSGWFVPSLEEFAAFADTFEIPSDNDISDYELSDSYWTSSLSSYDCAYYLTLSNYNVASTSSSLVFSVRLATTF